MKKRFVFLLIALAVGCSPQMETWRMTELCFESSTDYNTGGGDRVRMDVQFVQGQDTLVRPAFWDGTNVFRVRFAPTKAGKWTWTTTCPEDPSLDGHKGKRISSCGHCII